MKLTTINSKGEKTKTLQAKLNNYVDFKFSSIMPSIFDAATILFQTHPDAGKYAIAQIPEVVLTKITLNVLKILNENDS